ncbi:leucine-rich repeat protein [Capnocytophaga cynodegmi]|uniref:leucine-rich repeat protein n=1 Tax=Capnocytophaga cynodegmi TaxID=28189 RepID=UPI001EE25460|nr:leucine-rich repeat protein [Capnocytophaga cynodegmi]
MRKIGLILGLLCFGLVAMVSCDKDDNKQVEVPAKEIKISKDAVNVLVGETQVIDITDGNGGYKVKSSDENKAVVSIKGEKQIAVEGKNVGEATLTITDSKQKSITIKVTVSDFLLSATEISIIAGKSDIVQISSGSGNYEVTSEDANIATAEIVSNEVKITAKNVGATQVVVVDKKTNKKNSITVKVVNDLKMEKAELTVTNGDFEIINILGGDNANGNYEFEITATPTDVANTEHQWYDATQGHHLKVTGLKPGETTVTVKDKQTQQVTTFKVTVNLSEFSIPRTTLELSAGTSTTINIKGNGKYEVNSANSSIATAEESNGVLTITAVGSGSTEITVKDVMKDETKIISVVVKSSFTVDANGVLTAVEPSAIVANLVIPENVKEIKQDLFSRNAILVSVTMKSVEVVQENAFYFIRTLTSVTFGNKIREIKTDAFKFCTGLKSVKVEATTPPTLGNKTSTFRKISDAVLKVPAGTKAAYEASDWKEYFTNIVEE